MLRILGKICKTTRRHIPDDSHSGSLTYADKASKLFSFTISAQQNKIIIRAYEAPCHYLVVQIWREDLRIAYLHRHCLS
jgi:hypothetical protein